MKKFIKILMISTILPISLVGVSANHVEGVFDHHAHVAQGNPWSPKKVTVHTTYQGTYHYLNLQLLTKGNKYFEIEENTRYFHSIEIKGN